MPGALCCHSELQNGHKTFLLAEGGEPRFPSESEEMVFPGLYVGSEHEITFRIKYI